MHAKQLTDRENIEPRCVLGIHNFVALYESMSTFVDQVKRSHSPPRYKRGTKTPQATTYLIDRYEHIDETRSRSSTDRMITAGGHDA